MPILQEEGPCEVDNEFDRTENHPMPEQQISPLRESLFPGVPPTIRFFSSEYDDRILPLPVKIRNQLKWKLTNITPNILRDTLRRSGFKMTKDEHKWIGLWGKHMKNSFYCEMNEYQKVNHFPGSFHLGRKDRLHMNITRWRKTENADCSFVPRTFLLPVEQKAFCRAWKKEGSTHRWIAKPPASSKGSGVFIISRWNQISKRLNESLIIQKYIFKPMLIDERKFDLRLYALVTCWDPLQVYVYKQGMVRFATMPFSDSAESFSNTFMHLTNYSLNKMSSDYTDKQKWTMDDFWRYLQKEAPSVDSNEVWSSLVDVIVKTLVAAEAPISRLSNVHSPSRYSCFELFGFDILLDADLKPWLLEVNISPSMRATSYRDDLIKQPLICDLLNLVGLQLPNVENGHFDPTQYGLDENTSLFTSDNIRRSYLSTSEAQKISDFAQEELQNADSAILDHLTGADVIALVNYEDELERLKESNFERVVPSRQYSNVIPRRYWNRLLHAWEMKYGENRERGRKLLRNLCENGALSLSDSDEVADEVMSHVEGRRIPPRPRMKTGIVRLKSSGRLFIPNKISKFSVSDKPGSLSKSNSSDSFVSFDSDQSERREDLSLDV